MLTVVFQGKEQRRTMNLGSHLPFSCHITDSNVAPRFCIGDMSGEAGELEVSLLT